MNSSSKDDTAGDSADAVLAQLQLVTDAMNASFDAMFAINDTGVIRTVNKAACQLTGYNSTPEELVGQKIAILCGGGHAEHHDEYMQRYLRTGEAKIIGKRRAVTLKKKDGTEIPVELGIQEVVHGDERVFYGFLKDLSQEKEHEAAIRRHDLLLQGMIDASFNPMFGLDVKGRIAISNAAATAMFGWTAEEFKGQNISMICGGGHAEHHDEYIRRYLETGQKKIIGQSRAVKARRKDGSEFDVDLGVQEVVCENGERMFCGYIRDMTRQIMDKRKLQKKEQLIKGSFFGGDDGTK